MEGLQNIRTYQEFKAAADREVSNQAEGFVRLGYLLRRAEDTDILRESGYKTVTEFAKAEYGLTETYVSRYIHINKRYSEGGYSDKLQSRFMGFGLAKLADMLTLADEIVEAIPPEATRAEIQEIKKEVAMEQKISDLEVLAEGREEESGNLFSRVLKEYYQEHQKEYRTVCRAIKDEGDAGWKGQLADAMAPAGSAVKMVRIPGEGRIMLTIRGKDQEPELVKVRSGDKETFSWEEMRQCLKDLQGFCAEAAYQEGHPVREEPQKPKKRAVSVVSIAKGKEPGGENVPAAGKEPQKKEIAPVQEKAPETKAGKGEAGRDDEGEKEISSGEKDRERQQDATENLPDRTEEPDKALPEPGKEKKEKQERQEGQQDSVQGYAVPDLRADAQEQAEQIRAALEKGYYHMARMAAKKLIGILDEIGKELDRKGVPGQQEMKEYFG